VIISVQSLAKANSFKDATSIITSENGPYVTGDLSAAMRFCFGKSQGEICKDPKVMAALGQEEKEKEEEQEKEKEDEEEDET
jgi:hypothetical protein